MTLDRLRGTSLHYVGVNGLAEAELWGSKSPEGRDPGL